MGQGRVAALPFCFFMLPFMKSFLFSLLFVMSGICLSCRHVPLSCGTEGGSASCLDAGRLFLDRGLHDSASFYLNKALLADDVRIKASAYRSLSRLEKERGDLSAALRCMEAYADLQDSLGADLENPQFRERRIWTNRIAGIVILAFLLVFATIKSLKSESRIREGELLRRGKRIAHLEDEKKNLKEGLFGQTDICRRVNELSAQKKVCEKDRKVLSNAGREELKSVLFDIHRDYISELKEKYPRLTEDDLLYLCLQQTGLDSLTIALCLGFTNTQPVNQRRYRLKEKMRS